MIKTTKQDMTYVDFLFLGLRIIILYFWVFFWLPLILNLNFWSNFWPNAHFLLFWLSGLLLGILIFYLMLLTMELFLYLSKHVWNLSRMPLFTVTVHTEITGIMLRYISITYKNYWLELNIKSHSRSWSLHILKFAKVEKHWSTPWVSTSI